jgi:flagellum-specific peptidoglycan hydrolase FlgJ
MKYLISSIFILFSIVCSAQNTAQKYISRFDSLAVEVMHQYGIPASIVLGIALQESGAGTSKLCRLRHNHFGIKGKSTYRSFESDEAAYQFFGEMLSRKKYYNKLKNNMDYMQWLKAMKAGGYAASPSWITHVANMIKRHNLTAFDIKMPELQPALTDSIPSQ